MAIQPILRMGDPRLLRQAEPVLQFGTVELERLIADMFETMHHANGAGLAAPQIGVNLQVVIFGAKDSSLVNSRYPDAPVVPQTVLINPIIRPLTDEMADGWEGCLSVPGLRGVVPRFNRIHYEGFDQHGQPISREVDGFHARVVQHECDHLLGVLYPMRIKDFSHFGFADILFPDLSPDHDD